jgi:hypothetical protein
MRLRVAARPPGHGEPASAGADGADERLHVGARLRAAVLRLRRRITHEWRIPLPRLRGCLPQNPDVQQKLMAMQNDPELKDFFDAVKARRDARAARRVAARCVRRTLSRACLRAAPRRALRRRAVPRR